MKVIAKDALNRKYHPERLITVSVTKPEATFIADVLNKVAGITQHYMIVEDDYKLDLESMHDNIGGEWADEFYIKAFGSKALCDERIVIPREEEEKQVKGFDIDGVISLGIHPGPDDVIITGRSVDEEEYTSEMLKERGINNKVYFNPIPFKAKTRESSGLHKANTITELREQGITVTHFFEDDEIQYNIIMQMHPELKLVYVLSDLVDLENVWRGDKK